MSLFQGSGVAIVTPMQKDYTVNYEKLSELIEYHITNNTDAIIVCGTTGEASTLNDSEHKEVIKYTVDQVNGRIPVIAGTGSNDTEHAVMMSRYAESVGVDGVLLITPYYNKTTQRGLIHHFNAIMDSINIPAILYNVPSRTGVNINPETLKILAQNDKIVAIKEASGDIAQIAEYARIVPDDFYIYSGNDDSIVPLLSLGGKGVISVVANIAPKETHDLVDLFLKGKIKASRDLQLTMKPLIDALFCEVNPIPVKEALNILGFDVGDVRLPLYPMENKNREHLITELKNFGLK